MTHENPLISIIVPVYNVQDYLDHCLESILGQSYSKIEILAVDDGSSDESLNVLKSFQKKDPRLKIISQENQGVSVARNAGIASASGDYLIFVDSDDYIEHNMVEIMVGVVDEEPIDLVVCPYYSFSETQKRANYLSGGKIAITCKEDRVKLISSFFNGSGGYYYVVFNKMYRHEIIKKNDLNFHTTTEIFSEDTLFNFEILLRANNICTVETPLYNYRFREGSLMHSYKPDLLNRYGKLHDILREKLRNWDLLKCVEKEFGKFTFYINILILGNERYSDESFRRKLKIIKKVSKPGMMRDTIMKLDCKEYKLKRRAAFLLYRLRLPVVMYVMILSMGKRHSHQS